RLTVGTILVFLPYLASLYSPLEALVYTSSTVQVAAASARRVLEILEEEPDVEDRPGAMDLGAVEGRICFERVVFGYDSGRPALRSVSFEIPAGRTVAIVGETGAGKSTLASMVSRSFDPWEGRVTIDGVDVRDVRLT